MGKQEDEKLERWLRERRFEPADPDLAERIILEARHRPQYQTIAMARWLGELFAEFHLPQPSYVLAATLLLGILVGVNVSPPNGADEMRMAAAQSYLYADEALYEFYE